MFDGSHTFGTEFTGQVQNDARKLSWKRPELFEQYKESLGQDINYMNHRQVLSSFYYDTAVKPGLDEKFAAYV